MAPGAEAAADRGSQIVQRTDSAGLSYPFRVGHRDASGLSFPVAQHSGIVTVHANDIYVADQRSLRARLEHFDRVVTVCNFNIGLLNGMGDRRSATVAWRWCRAGWRSRLGTPGSSGGRGSRDRLGRTLRREEGFDRLIRALAPVHERFPNIQAVIVGDGPERAALTRLIADLELENNVTLAGARSHQATLELIETAKLFCLACRRDRRGDCDALPVVIREAMARAVPVVCTRVAGIPETIDEEVGWLVDPDAPAQLAGALTAALGDGRARPPRARGRPGCCDAGRSRIRRQGSCACSSGWARSGASVRRGRPPGAVADGPG